jgi:diguanylate cyclase (GGDEF)-like protein/PAS domain S-box-containing protein
MDAATISFDQERADLEKYRRIFYATPDYATFSNLKTGKFIDVNPGFEKMTGWHRDEVIGRTSADIDLWVIAEHRQQLVEELQKTERVSISTLLRTRTREVLSVEASLATFNLNGELLLVAVVRDVTARKRQELELEEYRTKLEKLVEQRTAELEQAMQRVTELAVHDDLTGLGNRRDLNTHLTMERQLFERSQFPCTVAVLDLDGFKAVNDRFGHAIGDEVIKAFAGIFLKEKRAVDYVARYGGDEFVVLLKGATPEVALAPLTRVMNAVREYDWSAIIPGMSLTTSVGIAGFAKGESPDDTFSRADKALYTAKTLGKNQIAISPMPE